ncbi:MAG: tetratricopeptide repeat protein, partial [Candidatus Eremiobacterota bacterium]
MKLKKIFLMSIFFLSLVLLPVLAKSLNEWIENGMNLCCEGRYEEAVKCYDKALEINPKNIDVLTKKGTALIDLEDYEESIKCFNSVLEIDPK